MTGMLSSKSRTSSSKRYLKRRRQLFARVNAARRQARLRAFLALASKQVTLTRVLFVAALAVVAIYLCIDLRQFVIVLDPVNLPKEFSDAGISPEVMTERVREELKKIERTQGVGNSSAQTQQTQPIAEDALPDLRLTAENALSKIEIPEAKISIGTLEVALREAFNTEVPHLSADLTYLPTTEVAKIRCRLLIEDQIVGSTEESQLQWTEEDISLRAEQAVAVIALQIAELSDPYLAALYLKTTNNGTGQSASPTRC